MLSDFKVGDRVEVIAGQQDFNTVGLLGTVRGLFDYLCNPCVGVEHDLAFDGGHYLNGLCRYGYGLYYYDAEYQLLLITDDEVQIIADGLEALL